VPALNLRWRIQWADGSNIACARAMKYFCHSCFLVGVPAFGAGAQKTRSQLFSIITVCASIIGQESFPLCLPVFDV